LSPILSTSCLRLLLRPHLSSYFPSMFKERSVHSFFQNKCSTDFKMLPRISISRIIALSKRLSSSCLRLFLHPHPLSFLQCVTKFRLQSIPKLVLYSGRYVVLYFSFQNNRLSPVLPSNCLHLLLHPYLSSIFSLLCYDSSIHSQFESDFFTEVYVTQDTRCQEAYRVAA
jgi:hypothetical protein